MTARNPLAGICSAAAMNCPPALLTRMSSGASSRIRVNAASTCSLSRTSATMVSTEPAGARSWVSSSVCAVLPRTKTFAPRSANNSAHARPIPLPPPVTSAVRPANDNAVGSVSGTAGISDIGFDEDVACFLGGNLHVLATAADHHALAGQVRLDISARRGTDAPQLGHRGLIGLDGLGEPAHADAFGLCGEYIRQGDQSVEASEDVGGRGIQFG